MTQPKAEFLGTLQLIERARAQPACVLATETQQSYPIPVPSPKGLLVAFLYCPSHVSVQTGLQLLAPTHLGFLRADTGKFEELRAVDPSEFGQPHKKGQLLGQYDMLPGGRTPEQFLSMQGQLYRDYDLLVPLFGTRQTSVAQEFKQAAGEFKTLFPAVTEQPLLPYYHAIGKEFFAWLSKIAA